MSDNHLLNEIMEEPDVLRRIYSAYVEREHPGLKEATRLLEESPAILMTGMATSEYGCYPASALLSHAGRANFIFDVSELLYYHLDGLPPNGCLVVVSQSGESAEIVHLLDVLKGRMPIIGVYNNEASTLAKGCSVGLPLLAGPQQACGSKTNTATLAVLNLLAESIAGRSLPVAGGQILKAASALEHIFNGWEEQLNPLVDFLEESAYTVFVGRGPGRASAMFSACLFREVPKVVAEGMAAADFRHGLREMITPQHRVVIFAPGGTTTRYLVGLAEDMQKIDVPVLLVTNVETGMKPGRLCRILRTGMVDEAYSPLVDIAPPQLIGTLLAKRRGLEPGKLVISTYITTVE